MTDEKKRTFNVKRLYAFMIANAIVWGAVIIGSSLALKGTGCWDKIQTILAVGAVFSIVILQGALLAKK